MILIHDHFSHTAYFFSFPSRKDRAIIFRRKIETKYQYFNLNRTLVSAFNQSAGINYTILSQLYRSTCLLSLGCSLSEIRTTRRCLTNPLSNNKLWIYLQNLSKPEFIVLVLDKELCCLFKSLRFLPCFISVFVPVNLFGTLFVWLVPPVPTDCLLHYFSRSEDDLYQRLVFMTLFPASSVPPYSTPCQCHNVLL